MPAARYNYEEIILSGRPVFFMEGEDYKELPEKFKGRWFEATKRRGLKLATWTVLDPPGIMLQSYLPTHERPPRPAGPVTTKTTKNAKRGVYCSINGCENRLSTNEQRFRECKTHR